MQTDVDTSRCKLPDVNYVCKFTSGTSGNLHLDVSTSVCIHNLHLFAYICIFTVNYMCRHKIIYISAYICIFKLPDVSGNLHLVHICLHTSVNYQMYLVIYIPLQCLADVDTSRCKLPDVNYVCKFTSGTSGNLHLDVSTSARH